MASKILSNLRFGVERVAGEIRSRGGEKTKQDFLNLDARGLRGSLYIFYKKIGE